MLILVEKQMIRYTGKWPVRVSLGLYEYGRCSAPFELTEQTIRKKRLRWSKGREDEQPSALRDTYRVQ